MQTSQRLIELRRNIILLREELFHICEIYAHPAPEGNICPKCHLHKDHIIHKEISNETVNSTSRPASDDWV